MTDTELTLDQLRTVSAAGGLRDALRHDRAGAIDRAKLANSRAMELREDARNKALQAQQAQLFAFVFLFSVSLMSVLRDRVG